jgi:hypothetical protein
MDLKNLSILDVTKSVAIMLGIFFLFFRVPNMIKENFAPKGGPAGLDRTEITQIAENIVQVKLKESDKELKVLIDKLANSDSEILKIVKSNKDRIEEVAVIRGKIGGGSDPTPDSDIIYGGVIPKPDITNTKDKCVKCPEYDPLTLVSSLVKADVGGDQLPIARIFYSPYTTDVNKWGTQSFQLEYHTSIIETTDEKGIPNRYVESWVTNDFVPESKGKKYKLPIKVEWAKGKTLDKKFRFNTRFGISAIAGSKGIFPALDGSLWSYGRTTIDMDWRFVDLYIGGNEQGTYLGFTPFLYNLHPFLPFLGNTFIGPTISVDTEFEKNYGLNLSVTF